MTSWIGACQLSLWDNIAGPKVQQLWIGVDEPCDELQITVARHSLAGDLVPPAPDAIDTTLQVFSKFDAVVLSTVFSAKHRRSLCKHSLSVIVHTRHLARLVALQHVFVDRITQLVRQLAALLEHASAPLVALAIFFDLLERLILRLERLAVEPLDAPSTAETFLATAASRSLDAMFVARAVTSTLQTHGCAVVAGSANVARINMFIASLLLFVHPADLARSAYAVPVGDAIDTIAQSFADSRGSASLASSTFPTRAQYVPNLMVQGVVDVVGATEGEGMPGSLTAGLSQASVLASMLPTTLILLDSRTVRQTAPFSEYLRMRGDCDRAAVSRVVAQVTGDAAAAARSSETDNVFRTVTEVAPSVLRILEQALSLPLYLRAAFVTTSMRLLMRKAVVLVKFVEATTRDGTPAVPDNVVKRLRADLGARDASDFSVLLGMAERLRPGSYQALGGDPSRIEEQLRELFESF
jgi:hypothetical protein